MLGHLLPPAVRIENFLGEATAHKLLSYATVHEADFRPSKVRNSDDSRIDLSFRFSKKLHNLGHLKTMIETAVSNVLNEVLAQMEIDYLQSYSLQIEMAWHGDGAFFRRHIDTMTYSDGPLSRRALTMVYYFHRKPKGFSGGHLRLYTIQGEVGNYRDIEPVSDSVVFFPSWLPHEVQPVRSPSGDFADGRFSINCWVHKILTENA
jgi:SM-20-related protein